MPHRRRRRGGAARGRSLIATAAALVAASAGGGLADVPPSDGSHEAEEAAAEDYSAWAAEVARQAVEDGDLLSADVILTELGRSVLRRMTATSTGSPSQVRVHIAADGFGEGGVSLPDGHLCGHAIGQLYGVEMTFLQFLLGVPAARAASAEEADYVYFPHCATIALFLLSGSFMMQLKAGTLALERHDTNQAQFLTPVVELVDRRLLGGALPLRVEASTAARACRARKPPGRCRLLFVNFLGRHWLPAFSRRFQDDVVVTHAAESSWLTHGSGQTLNYWSTAPIAGVEVADAWHEDEGDAFFAAVARVSAERWPQGDDKEGTAQQDIPLPLPVHAIWTRRSERWEGRDVLAFFAGAPNSPVRRALFQLFGDAGAPQTATYSNHRGEWLPAAKPRHDVQLHGVARRLRIREASDFMYRSRFCFVPDGDQPNTQRVVESAAHGCIPIVISSRWLPPFRRFIDWRQCAIFILEEEVPRLPSLLHELAHSLEALEGMHSRLKFLSRALAHGGAQRSPLYPTLLLAELGHRRDEGLTLEHSRRQRGGASSIRARRRPGARIRRGREFTWYASDGTNSTQPAFWEDFLLPPAS